MPGANTYLFGDNRDGKCGIGSLEPFTYEPRNLYAKFEKIDCGHHHSLLIDANMVLYSWGRNRYG